MNIRGKTIDGAFWNVGLAMCNKVATVLGQLALAWYLTPKDMGLANFALAIVAFAALLSAGGVGDVLLRRGLFEEEAGHGLWLSFFSGIVMTTCILGISLVSLLVFKAPVGKFLWILALGIFCGFPGTILIAGFKNKLNFKAISQATLITGIFFTVLAVILAKEGWGPYSLIIPAALQPAAACLALFAFGSRFPVRPLDFAKIKELLAPAVAISLTAFLVSLQFQAPVLVCGLTLQAKALGYFSWGWVVAGQAVFLLSTNLKEVLLPAFVQLKDDARYRAGVALRAGRVITAVLCVACGVQALMARSLITWLLPAKWLPAIPVVVGASIGLMGQGIWICGMAWLNACGRYERLLKSALAQTLTVALFSLIGVRVDGILGATIGCGLGGFAGALMCIASMDTDILAENFKTWILPFFSALAFLSFGLYFTYPKTWCNIPLSFFYTGLIAWLWCRKDDGSIKSVLIRLRSFGRV